MREKGYTTRKREEILKYLTEHCDMAVTIQDIMMHLEHVQVNVNLSTIYRYLEKLEAQGLVLKTLNGKREQATFQYIGGREECHNHLHMKCAACGIIYHLDCGFMNDITGHIYEKHGFNINCQESYLVGICKECGTNHFHCECCEKEN